MVKSTENRLLFRFVALFSCFIVAAHAVIFLLQTTQFLEVLNYLTASMTGAAMNLFGAAVIQNNEVLSWGNFSLKVITECTGLFLFIVYLGAVLSYPTSWKNKGIGLLGLPLLILLNLSRLVVLMIIGRYYYYSFDFVHRYLWQTTFIIMVIALWIIWIELVTHIER